MTRGNPSEPSTDLLTAEQVMDILISDAHLRRSAATCVLPAVRIDGQTYFRRSDLQAWHRRQLAAGTSSS